MYIIIYIYIILIKLHVMGFGSRPTDHLNDPFLSSDSACVCVCEPSEDVKLLILLFSILRGRGVRHDCGTALNEATTIMGYWV